MNPDSTKIIRGLVLVLGVALQSILTAFGAASPSSATPRDTTIELLDALLAR